MVRHFHTVTIRHRHKKKKRREEKRREEKRREEKRREEKRREEKRREEKRREALFVQLVIKETEVTVLQMFIRVCFRHAQKLS
jgi:hypothetical protein